MAPFHGPLSARRGFWVLGCLSDQPVRACGACGRRAGAVGNPCGQLAVHQGCPRPREQSDREARCRRHRPQIHRLSAFTSTSFSFTPHTGAPMSQQVRSHISKQIRAEMTRQCVTLPELQSLSRVQEEIISEYLAATREISFSELRPIFRALGKNLMQALSP